MEDQVTVLQNDLSPEGLRRVHLMAPAPLCPPAAEAASPQIKSGFGGIEVGGIWIPEHAQVIERQDEIRFYRLEASWKAQGDLVEYQVNFPCGPDCPLCHGSGCSWRRLVALWCLKQGERISQAVESAALQYGLGTGQDPTFAWTRTLPKGVEWGAPIPIGSQEILLFGAKWLPTATVAVGRGN